MSEQEKIEDNIENLDGESMVDADMTTEEVDDAAEQETVQIAEYLSQLAKKLEEAENRITTAEQNAVNANNAYIRMQAEFDNYRKRTADQSRKSREDGAIDILMKFIPILDVVNQALQMINDEKVAEGVRMIYRQMNDVLEGCGVTEIKALGQPFDPQLHNAVMRVKVNNPDQIDTVVEVFQKGYQLGERIIRHCEVKVGCE